jgi:hypothetical protein
LFDERELFEERLDDVYRRMLVEIAESRETGCTSMGCVVS